KLSAAADRNFRIRTITAGVKLASMDDMTNLQKAANFLFESRKQYEAMDYEVQTLRIATQPLAAYCPDWHHCASVDAIKRLDAFASEHHVIFNIGPVNSAGQESDEFTSWLAEIIANTENINCSLIVASPEMGIDRKAISVAAKIMSAISRSTAGGEGNFRFTANAYCPPGSPFFPAAYFEDDGFSIGLESADILQQTFDQTQGMPEASRQLKVNMEAALQPIARHAEKIAGHTSRPYLGIDTSPAPLLDVSIGRAIETLSGVPFGRPSTLSACAAITDVLKSLDIKSCGYSGLMLPILEDTTLAARAMQGTYSVSDLLLFSSVCGTGLDVVPLPGDVSIRKLEALVSDVAALAKKYSKPLSARLFPVPGKKTGDIVKFDNPYLTDSVVMNIE
ncbi:MAG: hypothetical protein ACI9MF_002645, partial [Gammaproteobacteria bacterium]